MDHPEYISRLEIGDEIAKRTCPNHEKEGDWRDKINKQIKYRISKGQIDTNTKGQVRFLDVSEYAKQKFPEKFDDWRSKPVNFHINCYGFAGTVSGEACWLPCTLDECHQHIKELSHSNVLAWDNIRELQAEIERLKPDAERYQENCAKLALNGKKPKSKREKH